MAGPRPHSGSFLTGLVWGVSLGFAALLLPMLWLGTDYSFSDASSLTPVLEQGWRLLQTNLRGSVYLFAVVLLAFLVLLQRLRGLLAQPQPELDRVVGHEQLLDLCANLFFGVGVIWTAVGMREALMHGLGDPAGAASAGAFAILQRLVEGGILLALSTTIVGGVGGYLMRVVKSLSLGQQLAALYMQESQRPAEANLAALQRIEGLLQHPGSAADSEPS
ncbi:MAG: hypothetical protein O7F73_05735 [Gammaproteobacteria bacterium]|nr:hypothetical protein [Gammaproteobacteria bacterium]